MVQFSFQHASVVSLACNNKPFKPSIKSIQDLIFILLYFSPRVICLRQLSQIAMIAWGAQLRKLMRGFVVVHSLWNKRGILRTQKQIFSFLNLNN